MISEPPDELLDAEFWGCEFDECYDIPNDAYFDRAKFDDAVRRLQAVLNRLKRP